MVVKLRRERVFLKLILQHLLCTLWKNLGHGHWPCQESSVHTILMLMQICYFHFSFWLLNFDHWFFSCLASPSLVLVRPLWRVSRSASSPSSRSTETRSTSSGSTLGGNTRHPFVVCKIIAIVNEKTAIFFIKIGSTLNRYLIHHLSPSKTEKSFLEEEL